MEPDECAPEGDLNETEKGKNPTADGRQGAFSLEIKKSLYTEFYLLHYAHSMV